MFTLPFGIHKQQNPDVLLLLFKQAKQERKFFPPRDMIDDLLDPFGSNLLRFYTHFLGNVHELVGEFHNTR